MSKGRAAVFLSYIEAINLAQSETNAYETVRNRWVNEKSGFSWQSAQDLQKKNTLKSVSKNKFSFSGRKWLEEDKVFGVHPSKRTKPFPSAEGGKIFRSYQFICFTFVRLDRFSEFFWPIRRLNEGNTRLNSGLYFCHNL